MEYDWSVKAQIPQLMCPVYFMPG